MLVNTARKEAEDLLEAKYSVKRALGPLADQIDIPDAVYPDVVELIAEGKFVGSSSQVLGLIAKHSAPGQTAPGQTTPGQTAPRQATENDFIDRLVDFPVMKEETEEEVIPGQEPEQDDEAEMQTEVAPLKEVQKTAWENDFFPDRDAYFDSAAGKYNVSLTTKLKPVTTKIANDNYKAAIEVATKHRQNNIDALRVVVKRVGMPVQKTEPQNWRLN